MCYLLDERGVNTTLILIFVIFLVLLTVSSFQMELDTLYYSTYINKLALVYFRSKYAN